MKFIENIGQAARLWSVQVAGIGAAASAIWLSMTEAQQQSLIDAIGLPPGVLALLTFAATIGARVVRQEALKDSGGGGGPDPTR